MKLFLFLIILILNLTNVIIGIISLKRKKFYKPLLKKLPDDAYDNYRKNVWEKEDKKNIEIREFW